MNAFCEEDGEGGPVPSYPAVLRGARAAPGGVPGVEKGKRGQVGQHRKLAPAGEVLLGPA